MGSQTHAVKLEGQQLGAYRIDKAIGAGGMAQVYQGVQTIGRRRPVAIKVLAPQLRNRPDAEAMFQREAAELKRAEGIPGSCSSWNTTASPAWPSSPWSWSTGWTSTG